MSDSATKLDGQSVVIAFHDTAACGSVVVPLVRQLVSAGARPILLQISASRERGFGIGNELIAINSSYKLYDVSANLVPDELTEIAATIKHEARSVKLLINVALFAQDRQQVVEGLDLHYRLNFLSHVLCTHALLPLLADDTPSTVLSVVSAHMEDCMLLSEEEYENQAVADSYDAADALGVSQCALAAYTMAAQSRFSDRGVHFLTVNIGTATGLPPVDRAAAPAPAAVVSTIIAAATNPELSRGSHDVLQLSGNVERSKVDDLREGGSSKQREMYALALKQLHGLPHDPLEGGSSSGEGFLDMFTGCCGISSRGR